MPSLPSALLSGLLALLALGLASCCGTPPCCPPPVCEPIPIAPPAGVPPAALPTPEPVAEEPAAEEATGGTEGPIVIELTAAGRFAARWPGATGDVLAEGDLASGSPEESQAAIDRLRAALTALAARSSRAPDGSSTLKVLLVGDRGAKWKYVQWIMQACAQEDVRIYKMQFRVKAQAD